MKEIKCQTLDDIVNVRDYTYYNPAYLPELLMIPARYRPSPYPTEAPPGPEDELSKHVASQH
jgi:hypothetical protein